MKARTSRTQHFCAAALAACSVGCANSVQVNHGLAVSGDVPDATKAYLVINANAIPAKRLQPRWIYVWRNRKSAHLTTKQDVFELHPGRYLIMHADFGESPNHSAATIDFDDPLEITLRPGVIHYFGRLEIEPDPRSEKLHHYLDPELYRRACDQAPAVFRRFEVVAIGPLTRYEPVFPACDKLLQYPGGGLDGAPREGKLPRE